MKNIHLASILILVIVCGFTSVTKDLFHAPAEWPKPHYDFSKNPLTQEKIMLGRILFYDPVLSRDSTISCNSCHSQYTAFAHVDHKLSHGIANTIGTRNAPSLMNLAWQNSFMWDGAINHLDMQPLAPISNKDEMGSSMDSVVIKLRRSTIYPFLFLKAFGDSVITGEHTLKALSQFMLTMVSADSRYDSVMRGQRKFTPQEENGYRLFKINCACCHTEPLFTNFSFENNGLPVDSTLRDAGRILVTHNPDDSLKFKTPSLRNIEFSYPYMHDGRFRKLSDVLNHYTKGISRNATISKALKKQIVLSSAEKVDIVSFLLTLTDKRFLFNPEYSYPGKALQDAMQR